MSSTFGNNGGRTYSTLVKPVWIDCNFIVDAANTNGLGIKSLVGSGVRNVFMHTSQTPGANRGYTNPNPLAGYALIQLAHNYNKYCGGFNWFAPTTTGSNIAINATALTAHTPYIITAVGHSVAGTVTIAPVADSAGSLASTWFSLYDNYGNTFIIWFSVAGVGAAPKGVSGTLVQQSIASGATAAQVGTALATTIANLPSGISGVNSFTATGTTTVTVVSTQTNPQQPLPGTPADGVIPTGFTFAAVDYTTNLQCWQGVGLPAGLTPTVGQSFIATSTGFSTGGGSTGTVKLATVSGLKVEILGNPSLSLAGSPQGGSPHTGGWVMVQFLGATDASTTTLIPAAPADNTNIGFGFYVEASSVVISGE